MSSPPPKPSNPLALFALLFVVLLGIGLYLHLSSDVRDFPIPVLRGRTVLDRLYGAVAGSFFIYAGFRTLRKDVAESFAGQGKGAHHSSHATRLLLGTRWATAFAILWFVIGGSILAYEAITLLID